METTTIVLIAFIGVVIVIFLSLFFWITRLRRVVAPNQVHIVRKSRKTDVYGGSKAGETSGNSYYEFPAGLPVIGVTVMKLPLDIFDIDLIGYEAYDQDRVPFVVDIKAFFRISDFIKAAERISNVVELEKQLRGIVEGAVRSILAKQKLDTIMEDRATYGEEFTKEISEQLKEWGVETVKSIELMDVRDAKGEVVISNIMEKQKSHISMESRVQVAKNKKLAEEAEILSDQEIELKKQEKEQIVGIRTADAKKAKGIADEEAAQEIEMAKKTTAEKKMEVLKVETIRKAEIDKEAAIVKANEEQEKAVINKKKTVVNAEATKAQQELDAEAKLTIITKEAEGKRVAAEKNAEAIKLEGTASADAKSAMELAIISGQVELAAKIGENQGYQDYLVRVRQVEAQEQIGVANAKALENAQVKVLAQGGNASEGMNNVLDLFSAKGGANIAAGIEALASSEVGKSLLEKLGVK